MIYGEVLVTHHVLRLSVRLSDCLLWARIYKINSRPTAKLPNSLYQLIHTMYKRTIYASP